MNDHVEAMCAGEKIGIAIEACCGGMDEVYRAAYAKYSYSDMCGRNDLSPKEEAHGLCLAIQQLQIVHGSLIFDRQFVDAIMVRRTIGDLLAKMRTALDKIKK